MRKNGYPQVNLAPQVLINCHGGGTCDGKQCICRETQNPYMHILHMLQIRKKILAVVELGTNTYLMINDLLWPLYQVFFFYLAWSTTCSCLTINEKHIQHITLLCLYSKKGQLMKRLVLM